MTARCYAELGKNVFIMSLRLRLSFEFLCSSFLPRDASAERGNATVSRLSVRL